MYKNIRILESVMKIFIMSMLLSGIIYAQDIPTTSSQTMHNANETLQNIAVPMTYISLGNEIYQIAKDTRSILSPSEQEQVHAIETEKKLKLLQIKRGLRECLLRNRYSKQLNNLGVPINCEKLAYTFALIDDKNEAHQIINAFNKYK